MIVMKIKINGQLVISAGRCDMKMLTSNIVLQSHLMEGKKGLDEDSAKGVYFDTHFGGFTAESDTGDRAYLHWVPKQKLHIGDEISIVFEESENIDTPDLVEDKWNA